MPTSSFAAALSEEAGERSGFALNINDLVEHLSEGNAFKTALVAEDELLRIASDDYADTVGDLLHALGATEQPGMPTLSQRLIRRMGPDWRAVIDLMSMMELESVANHYLRLRNETGQFDHGAFKADLDTTVGQQARTAVYDDLLEMMSLHLAQSPWFTRVVRKADRVALTALFNSELLPSSEGEFFDQRFSNYLAEKPDLIQDVNWRQFEGLTAEWLSRCGYDVELGSGRNDGGIDVRAWRKGEDPTSPPAVIVQCKREKRKVGKVVIKALWADIQDERAESGLIVTTNDISPGAAKVVEARAYPITAANRAEVQRWLRAMRRPEAGIVI